MKKIQRYNDAIYVFFGFMFFIFLKIDYIR